MLDVHKGIVKY